MRKPLVETVMESHECSRERAEKMVREAKTALQQALEEGDLYAADNVCEDVLGLEPDFLDELF